MSSLPNPLGQPWLQVNYLLGPLYHSQLLKAEA